jgi:hypothetical protein
VRINPRVAKEPWFAAIFRLTVEPVRKRFSTESSQATVGSPKSNMATSWLLANSIAKRAVS